MFDILIAIRQTRKAFKKARIARQLAIGVGDEILRNAMGYAYEIGAGAMLTDRVKTTSGNPFLDPNWRDNVWHG